MTENCIIRGMAPVAVLVICPVQLIADTVRPGMARTAGNYLVEVGWVIVTAAGLVVPGCLSSSVMTELGSLSALASSREICHI